MFLLDELSNLPDNKRGDAVHVSRKISSLVNSNDENGIIIGNWSGHYDDGISPLGWTGSASILDEYFKYKKPVKYGQCFTFSGVVTTVCRALGIPARSVTNYNSAHDTDGSITVDTYFDRNFEEIGELNTDSIWNFHSWNDVWMTRPDLPPGYDGWQAIDSTPQERSKGIYCLGPMSLKAIKSGRVYLPYDGPMAFAEVNADKILWMNYSPGKLRAVKTDKSFVGKLISTKKPLANSASTDWMTGLDKDREDITDQYKFPEGTEEERIAVEEAKSYRANDDFEDDTKKDVEFEVSADNNTFIGETLQVSLKVTNQRSKKTRTVVGLINVKTIYYTGVPYKEVVKGKLPRTAISGKDEKMFRIDVPVNRYLDKLTDHFFLSVTCSCMIEETEQTFADTVEVRLRKPHLTIEAPDTGYIGQPFKAETTFTNPLPVPLTNCYLRAEGPGRQLPITYKLQGINQGQAVKIIVGFTPVKAGEKEIIMNCTSDQLANINATRPIYING
ncbi:protein-glutamine gamma-glutamyltransferase K-like [Ruditapes philippinarum]|uniref:protein-glutamine gamma-glutamyltransferase K-like n=1 Tax=Ruditapes philippinarum TaxID=129788 RepID=UPI00295C0EC8|nr:protein-glutamine gamma-glutamyltransferase K-like [Ruditapes philippinarum]